MCMTIFSPPGARAERWQGSLSRRQASMSMKLGMTSMRSRGTPKSLTVSSFRNSETAVSPWERRMEKLVIGRNEGWSPTSVMSVPCSVVTMGRSRSGASISRATQADVAWGMA